MNNYIREYNNAIECGLVTVGRWIRMLYRILVYGIDEGVYLYDADRAEEAVAFIEEFCRHSKGKLAPNRLKLELWQKAAVAAIFGTLNPKTGKRQFREVLLIVARKNGKSLFAAAIMAYIAYIDGEYGAELYCLAPKLDQANIVFDAFHKISMMDPDLAKEHQKRRSDIYIPAKNTTVAKLAFNARKADGFNPQFTNCDEIEAWPPAAGLKQYDVMTSGTGAREEPLTMSTGTAGYENDGIYDELFARGTAFLKGNSEETAILPIIYQADDGEKWDTMEEIMKANPNLGVSVQWSFFEEEIRIARASRSKRVEFKAKYLNLKQNSSVAWLDFATVAACKCEQYRLEDFRGCKCVAGIDLSKTTDLTAACIIIERGGINYIFCKFFMPEERYKVAIEEEGIPYDKFREQGDLVVLPGHTVDYHAVYDWLVALVKQYKIIPLRIGYDRYSADYLVQDLEKAGFTTDDVYQGTNLTPVITEFEGGLLNGLYRIGQNNLLMSHLLNVALKENSEDDRKKPVKISKRSHIDGAVAVLDALTMKMKYHKQIGARLKNAA